MRISTSARSQRLEAAHTWPRRERAPGGKPTLTVICGPMFACKTSELVAQIDRLERPRVPHRVLTCVPACDRRYDASGCSIATHNGTVRRADVSLPDGVRLLDYIAERQDLYAAYAMCDAVAVDEAQFVAGLYDFCDAALADGKTVLVAGLALDAHNQLFGDVARLALLAPTLIRKTAVCACGEAAYSSKHVGAGVFVGQVLVGAEDAYVATCHKCYSQETTAK